MKCKNVIFIIKAYMKFKPAKISVFEKYNK